MTLRAQVLSAIRWSATAKLSSQLISWAITLLVIRLLSPGDYGLVAMSMVVISFVSMFAEFGLSSALVQRANVDERMLRQAFAAILSMNLSLALILVLVAPFVGVFYDEPGVVPILRVFALQFVLSAFAIIPDALLQRRMEFRNRSLLALSGAVLNSLTTLALALAGAGVWALVLGSLASQLWSTLGLQKLSPFLRRPDFSIPEMLRLFRSGGQLTAANVFLIFYSQVDVLICAKLLGNEIVGFYSVALHLASLPTQRIAPIVNQVAFPAFSRIQHDLSDVATKALLGIRLLSFLAFPSMWGFSSIAPEFVEVILGPNWIPSIFPMQVLAVALSLRLVGSFIGTALYGMGRFDIVLHNSVWAAAVSSPLFFVGAHIGALGGLSLAWLVVVPFIFVPAMLRSAPAIGLSFKQVLAAMLPAAGVASAMYCAVVGVRFVLADGVGAAMRLCILVTVGALVYCGVSFVLNRRGMSEALQMMRSLATPRGT